MSQQQQSYQNKNKSEKKDGPNFESSNRFASLSDHHPKNNKQVFQKEEPGDTITLKDLMKELMSFFPFFVGLPPEAESMVR